MSGDMNRIPQAQLDEWKWEAQTSSACGRWGDSEIILKLIAEVEDLTKTLAGFGEEG